MKPIVLRHENNPILTKREVPYPVETVHNAGMAKFDGRYIMLFRSHRRNGRSIIGLAESEDGWTILTTHFLFMAYLLPFSGGIPLTPCPRPGCRRFATGDTVSNCQTDDRSSCHNKGRAW